MISSIGCGQIKVDIEHTLSARSALNAITIDIDAKAPFRVVGVLREGVERSRGVDPGAVRGEAVEEESSLGFNDDVSGDGVGDGVGGPAIGHFTGDVFRDGLDFRGGFLIGEEVNIAVWIEFAGFFNSENCLLIGGKEGGAVGIFEEEL